MLLSFQQVHGGTILFGNKGKSSIVGSGDVDLTEMESRMEPSTSPDGTVKEPLAAAEAIAAVLCRGNRKPNFLKNIGVVPSHKSVPHLCFLGN